MNRSRLLASALFMTLLTLGGSLVLAHGGATGVVKERMDLMEGIGERMKTLSKMFKGEVPYDPATVEEAAGHIRDHGGEKVTALFPEGSLDEPTEALPAIWEDWDRFERLSLQLVDYADALAEAADNPRPAGGMMGQGAGMMGRGQGPGMADGRHMMGQGQGMMVDGRGQGAGMMADGQGMMMGGGAGGPDPEMLASMPPDAAFTHLAQTCNACHTKFRVEKKDDH